MKKSISVIGAPVWLGQPHFGTQFAPDALRAAGLMQVLRSLSDDVVDVGNACLRQAPPSLPLAYRNMKHLESVKASVELLSQKVSEAVSDGRFPLVLGGDHSIALGSLAGIARHYKNLGVIWYDAHADINTPETSPTGNIHGMPLAASMGLGHKYLTTIGGYSNKIKPENIVFIGVRDMDPGEKDLINQQGIKVFTSEDVMILGAKAIINEATAHLTERCDGIHLSFDLDVLDPTVASAVGTPAPHGVDLNSTIEAMELLFRHNVISSADIVEINPLLDRHGNTVTIALSLIQMLLGGTSRKKLSIRADIAV